MTGYFDQNRLYVEIAVAGTIPGAKKVVKAHIDTGYDGYLTLPFTSAFPLDLALVETKTYIIADGSSTKNFVCRGTITINKQEESIPIDVFPNSEILLGLPLIEKLGNNFQIDFTKKQIKFT